MEPVERSDHTNVYRGEHEDPATGQTINEGVGDLTYKRGEVGQVLVHFVPTLEELRVLTQGGHVELAIYAEPIPPVSLVAVPTPEQEAAADES
jgi:hypothetical protein